MKKKYEVNIRIDDKEVADNINSYCALNHCNYKELATKVFKQFFKNERSKLEMLSKEQLIEVILKQKKEGIQ